MQYQDLRPWKTKKEAPKDEEAVNAEFLIRAGFIDKVMAGVYTFLPLGLRVVKKIEALVRKEMETLGGQELLMPTLQPNATWATTGRIDTYDSLFKFTSFYSKIDYVLGPTHEEIITPLVAKHIQSYKDLPCAFFQIQTKMRDEKRAKSGLLRGREFLMKDLYSFHRDEQDLDEYYEKVKKSYHAIFNAVGIGARTHLTVAAGGTFSKYSHEFQTTTEAGEDTIHICTQCGVAINEEIRSEQKNCPECNGTSFSTEKAIEVGNIFKLKTKFSNPFKAVYKDEKGALQEIVMGCYGLGIHRLMGAIVEVYHDKKGMRWPAAVAPFKVHLIELKGGDAAHYYRNLQAKNIEVLYDNRKEVGAGEKLADADLIGIPWRVVVSEKTGNNVELKARTSEEVKLVSIEDVIQQVKSIT